MNSINSYASDGTIWIEVEKGNVPGTSYCDCSPRNPIMKKAPKLSSTGKPYLYFWAECTQCEKESFKMVEGTLMKVVETRVLDMWDNPPEQ